MTALLKLFRTTAFKLALVYSTIFSLVAASIVFQIGFDVQRVLEEQVAETIEADMRGLVDIYNQGGLQKVVEAIDRRLKDPGGEIYLVTSFTGEPISGNVAALPPELVRSGDLTTTYYRPSDESRAPRKALARTQSLPGGFRLLVGQDVSEPEKLKGVLQRSLTTSFGWLAFLGAVGGLLVARRLLIRVDAMSESASRFMAGDLAGRLPSNGSGDELDRLAQNLNAMLARIATLMSAMREVTDNVAHDLRTPLTRLRNRAETARGGAKDSQTAASLEEIIDEADGLIRIFDALLLIARGESGSGPQLEPIDLAVIVRDVGELYEAAAEETGGELTVETPPTLKMRGNRELMARAIANLMDNALKYGLSPEDGAARLTLVLSRRDGEAQVVVADRGAGVPEADLDRISERFVRLERSRTLPGSGLGLSLVAAIARMMNGRLVIEDNGPGLKASLVFAAPGA